MVSIRDMLQMVVDQQGSDLHLIAGSPPTLRIHGELTPIPDQAALLEQDMEALITPLLSPEQKELFNVNKELDFSFQFEQYGRFRINAYHQKGIQAASLRLIPSKIKSIEELGLPQICHQFASVRQGLVLVTGPTGQGKSSTLAAIIEEVNQTRGAHIVTIEDPIEFVYTPAKSLISQREIHSDTHSWDIALRSVVREDPDVVLVGEMRDYETIAAALTVAETGHLVFATLHTNSAAQTIDRIIDVFPAEQQAQIRSQLALTIEGVFSQRLLPSLRGGRVAAAEVLIATSAVRNLIREGKSYQIDNVIQTSSDVGMTTLNTHLGQLLSQELISEDVATEYGYKPEGTARSLSGR
ncbi:MAG TPA: type IV pilus twitching motility protein PilT [Patescibacteria group bacterium]|nr:type IV pilus twitching motility protein PilT [Patescibacteria group bacterium]